MKAWMFPIIVVPLEEGHKLSQGDTLRLPDGREVWIQAIYPWWEYGKALVWVGGKEKVEGEVEVIKDI